MVELQASYTSGSLVVFEPSTDFILHLGAEDIRPAIYFEQSPVCLSQYVSLTQNLTDYLIKSHPNCGVYMSTMFPRMEAAKRPHAW